MIYWFTGQPGAGKTVLSTELVNFLSERGQKVIHIDGDDMRDIFQNKNYGKEGRLKNIETAQNIAQFLNAKGFDVVVSLVSPYRDQRENFKSVVEGDITEFYIHTTGVRERDHYKVPDYEEPLVNFIDIDTTNDSPEESFNYILACLN